LRGKCYRLRWLEGDVTEVGSYGKKSLPLRQNMGHQMNH
jgi:hypothetical protein